MRSGRDVASNESLWRGAVFGVGPCAQGRRQAVAGDGAGVESGQCLRAPQLHRKGELVADSSGPWAGRFPGLVARCLRAPSEHDVEDMSRAGEEWTGIMCFVLDPPDRP